MPGVDSRNKRFSMISLAQWRGRIVSNPDGGIDTQAERFQWVLLYPLESEPPPPTFPGEPGTVDIDVVTYGMKLSLQMGTVEISAGEIDEAA